MPLSLTRASTPKPAEMLKRQGYAILRKALDPDIITRLDADLEPAFTATPFCTGSFYGSTTKRFGQLLTRSRLMSALVQHPAILRLVERLLTPWCDVVQLNVTQAIAVHPGAPAQLPHRDQDMWRGPVGEIEYLVNVIWPLTPFRRDNGATLVWPESHGRAALAQTSHPPVAADMDPGDALIFLGSTLHGAGSNQTETVRRGLVVGYSLGWLKPYENMMLAYPPAVARRFAPELAALVGYRQHRPNLGNFEGQCPSILLGDYQGEPLGAVDALRPDQQALIDSFEGDADRER